MTQVIMDLRIVVESDDEDKAAIQAGMEAAFTLWQRKGLPFATTEAGTEIQFRDVTVLQYDEEIEAQEAATSRE